MNQQTVIPAFEGLQSSIAPDLIKDGEARVLVNFRQESVGKLISRNGVVQGIFDNQDKDPYSVSVKSIHGIAEIILESEWSLYGTDRFMVYGVQVGTGYYSYVFAPLDTVTGNSKSDVLITDFAWDFSEYDPHPHGSDSRVQLNVLGQDFKTRFVSMNQFQRRLIISDPINGDMQVINKRDESETYPKPPHDLELRSITLPTFDVNVVSVTYPDPSEGITTPMGLYRFVLPKRKPKMTDDNFTNTVGNQRWWGSGERKDFRKKSEPIVRSSPSGKSFMTYLHFNDWVGYEGITDDILNPEEVIASLPPQPFSPLRIISHLQINREYPFVFSNADSPNEFDDVMGELRLPSDEYQMPEREPNGTGNELAAFKARNKVLERVADVHIWDEHSVPYYRASVNEGGDTLLTGIARTWEKTVENVPRIVQLNPKKSSPEGDVPLAVWRYRFVWDFGNGQYSAPSAELPIADSLWSAVKNDDYYVPSAWRQNSPPKNDRPANIHGLDFVVDVTQPKETIQGPVQLKPTLFSSPTTLTSLGELFRQLKQRLYDIEHKYGGKGLVLTERSAGELGTIITVDFGETVKMAGFISEAANMWKEPIATHIGKLIVPIFPSYNEQILQNSIFTHDGKLRFMYSRTDVRWLIVVPGEENSFILKNSVGSFQTENDKLDWLDKYNGDLYLNLLCDSLDNDNVNDSASPLAARLNTALRAVKVETERLENVKSDIPTEVRRRLVLDGVAEIPLIQRGNVAYFNSDQTLGGNAFRDVFGYRLRNILPPVPPLFTFTGVINNVPLANYQTPTQLNEWKEDGTMPEIAQPSPLGESPRNLSAYIYGPAQRFIGIEQLTAVFPASLLFQSPQVQLDIPQSAIPSGARRLLIFRTRSTHDNYYDPNSWGLVDRVDVNPQQNFKYFDTVKDNALDYTEDINEFNGLTVPLKSRYNVAANDRMYYLNYIEEYQAQAPKGTVQITPSAEYIMTYRDGVGLRSRAVSVTPTKTETVNGKEVRVFSLLPTIPDGAVETAELFRRAANGSYYKVADVLPADEGVVADRYSNAELDKLPTLNLDSLKPSIEHYESGVRYSEVNEPNHIRLESGVEFNRGDGDEITGVEKIYGNLLIFKENSIHRIGVDGTGKIPFTRRDEISPDIGCIAPRTILNVNNTIYFLSWKGFFAYDNNAFQRMDGKFAEEIRKRLYEDGQGQKNSWVRFASCGYNAVYNEIYLNIPSFPRRDFAFETTNEFPPLAAEGFDSQISETIKGDVFVISLDKGYSTTFTYEIPSNSQPQFNETLSRGRLYYTNSLGELRSVQMERPTSQIPATIYKEAPTEKESDSVRYDATTVEQHVVRALFGSKWFTGAQESFIKRVRKVVVNLSSKRSKTIRLVSVTADEQEERTDAITNEEAAVQQYTFPDPTLAPVPESNMVRNILEIVPTTDEITHLLGVDDIGKPIRFSVEIETKGRAQLNQLSFYWRPIKTHLH